MPVHNEMWDRILGHDMKGPLSERQIGYRLGVRASITWLHDYAKTMNDPKAKAILDSAAFALGQTLAETEQSE